MSRPYAMSRVIKANMAQIQFAGMLAIDDEGQVIRGDYEKIFARIAQNVTEELKKYPFDGYKITRVTILLSVDHVPFDEFGAVSDAYLAVLKDLGVDTESEETLPTRACYWVAKLPFDAPIEVVVDLAFPDPDMAKY